MSAELDAVTALAVAARRALDARDRAIRAAIEAGHTTRQVGEAAGLSHTGAAKIATRTSAEPPSLDPANQREGTPP